MIVQKNPSGVMICAECGERADPLYRVSLCAPYTGRTVMFWLCKVCMSRLSTKVENEIVGDPLDSTFREELQLRTEALREMDMAKKYGDLPRHPSN